MLRRLCLALSVVVVGLACVASAAAAPAETFSISWVMLGEGASTPPGDFDAVLPSCGGVPAGMWVTGTGSWTFFDATGNAGNLNSMAHGSAVDSAGNSYRWNYHQTIQPLSDGVHSRVVDDFVLSGRGPAGGIRSHFIAVIEGTSLEETPSFELLHLQGDPFNCDPL
jgi:hypothetical protein